MKSISSRRKKKKPESSESAEQPIVALQKRVSAAVSNPRSTILQKENPYKKQYSKNKTERRAFPVPKLYQRSVSHQIATIEKGAEMVGYSPVRAIQHAQHHIISQGVVEKVKSKKRIAKQVEAIKKGEWNPVSRAVRVPSQAERAQILHVQTMRAKVSDVAKVKQTENIQPQRAIILPTPTKSPKTPSPLKLPSPRFSESPLKSPKTPATPYTDPRRTPQSKRRQSISNISPHLGAFSPTSSPKKPSTTSPTHKLTPRKLFVEEGAGESKRMKQIATAKKMVGVINNANKFKEEDCGERGKKATKITVSASGKVKGGHCKDKPKASAIKRKPKIPWPGRKRVYPATEAQVNYWAKLSTNPKGRIRPEEQWKSVVTKTAHGLKRKSNK
jgi:hypothetical protein